MIQHVIRGRVIDADGRPIEGVDVRLSRPHPTKPGATVSDPPVRTDADGRFVFVPPPKTDAGLTLSAWPQADQPFRRCDRCEVSAGGDTTIVLAPGVGLSVRLAAPAPGSGGPSRWSVSVQPTRLTPDQEMRLRAVAEQHRLSGADAAALEPMLWSAGLDSSLLRSALGGSTRVVWTVAGGDAVTFAGLECGTYRLRCRRAGSDAADPPADDDTRCTVESGDAEVGEGRLVLRSPGIVVVRVDVAQP